MSLFVFAAARDGDMLLDSVQANSPEAARIAALAIAKDYHGLVAASEDVEGELDGFDIRQIDEFGQ